MDIFEIVFILAFGYALLSPLHFVAKRESAAERKARIHREISRSIRQNVSRESRSEYDANRQLANK